MTEPIDSAAQPETSPAPIRREGYKPSPFANDPPNVVHARVGDAVLLAARDGVRRGKRPDEIMREIVVEHGVRLNLGELHLLLAARWRASDTTRPTLSFGGASKSLGESKD